MEKSKWHIWVVGVLSLLWNAGGAFDYLSMKFGSAAYQEMLSPEQLAYFNSYPLWINIAWPVAVWGAVLGSLLILLRNQWAVAAFAVSLVAMLLNVLYGYALADPGMVDIAGPFELAFTAAIVIVGVLLLHYARRMRDAGQLR